MLHEEVINRKLLDKASELFAQAITQKATDKDMIVFWDLALVGTQHGITPTFCLACKSPILGAPAISVAVGIVPAEASCQIESVAQVVDNALEQLRTLFFKASQIDWQPPTP